MITSEVFFVETKWKFLISTTGAVGDGNGDGDGDVGDGMDDDDVIDMFHEFAGCVPAQISPIFDFICRILCLSF